MATTLGHALSGIDCLVAARIMYPQVAPKISIATIVAAVLLANLPDFDLLGGPLVGEHPHYFHGQMTHSIVFSGMVGAFLLAWGMISSSKLNHCKIWASFSFAAVLSHVLIDWLTGPNPGFNPSYGTMILWPFEMDRVKAPVTLFLGPQHASLSELFSLHNLNVMIRELLIFGGIGALLVAASARMRREVKTFVRHLDAKRKAIFRS